jgi:hypothetical protein
VKDNGIAPRRCSHTLQREQEATSVFSWRKAGIIPREMKWIRGASKAALIVSACAISSALFGQSTNSADLRGTVTDPTGGLVPGVTVTILNTDTGVSRTLTTNNDGLYDAVSILPGHYQLTFTKAGFEKLVRSGITLNVGAVTVNVQLSVGATEQQISVSEQAPLLHTDTAEQSSTLESQTMQEMPNVSRDWANFIKIIPGASAQGTSSGNPGTTLSINGTMPN